MNREIKIKIEDLFNSQSPGNIDLAFQLMKSQSFSLVQMSQIWSYCNHTTFESTKDSLPKLAYFIPSKNLLAINYVLNIHEPSYNANKDHLYMNVEHYHRVELYDLNKSEKPFKVLQQKSGHRKFLNKGLGILIKKYFLPIKIPIV